MRIQMKHTLLYIISGCLCLLGCRQEDSFLSNAGRVKIDFGVDDEVAVAASRSTLSDEESNALRENCKIRIFNNGKLVNRYGRWSEVPEDGILMPVGDKYSTLVVAGDSVPASFEDKYYKGTESFSVVKGQTKEVNVNCNIVNTLVKIEYSQEWNNLLEEAKVTVSVEGGSLEYPMAEETKTGYFIAPEKKPVIKCLFSGKTKTGTDFSYENIIESVKEATLYTVTYSPSEGEPIPGNYGGGFFELKVDETPLYTQDKTVMVYQRPVVSATNGSEKIDLSADMFVATGATMSPVFTFSGSTPLKTVIVESELLTRLGLNSNSLDIISEQQQFKGKGLNVVITEDKKNVRLEFGDKLNSYFISESSYSMKFTATDTYDEIQEGATAKTREIVWNIIVSDANITSINIPEDRRYEIWSDKAVFYGQNLEGKAPTGTLYFRYREKDTETWSEYIPAVTDDNYYKTAQITGLKPGTTYQYQMVEGTKVSNVISEVTTDAVHILDNYSFEDVSYEGKILRISKDPGNYWWDSGNEGSATMSVNVTSVDTSIKHSGNQSLYLKSQFVGVLGIGKFAAGNLFVGEFLGTEDTYYGILGWGRPFETRPYALKAWVKYTPGTVDYTETDKISKGDLDIGKIYIAVGDWVGDDPSYPQWPVVVRTLGPKLFDPNSSGTIGYGEIEFTETLQASDGGMVEVEIPINYENYGGFNRVPKSIIIVATASKYGDYYSGSTSSAMWLDDMELVYEESKLSK